MKSYRISSEICERARETDTEKERQTHRQIETDRQRDWLIDWYTVTGKKQRKSLRKKANKNWKVFVIVNLHTKLRGGVVLAEWKYRQACKDIKSVFVWVWVTGKVQWSWKPTFSGSQGWTCCTTRAPKLFELVCWPLLVLLAWTSSQTPSIHIEEEKTYCYI